MQINVIVAISFVSITNRFLRFSVKLPWKALILLCLNLVKFFAQVKTEPKCRCFLYTKKWVQRKFLFSKLRYVFLLSRQNLENNGNNPTLLYGYGGFNISLSPGFRLSALLFVQHFGGVYATANLRGGSEYGERWHEGGMKLKKQNVFDDFIGAAEYLISEKITNPNKWGPNTLENTVKINAESVQTRYPRWF